MQREVALDLKSIEIDSWRDHRESAPIQSSIGSHLVVRRANAFERPLPIYQ